MKPNPINAYHEKRRLVFATYNKRGYDDAMEIVIRCKSPQWKSGLAAEILVYDKFRRRMKLQPLLDAGDKADLTGKMGRRMANFDVTTNLKFKDIDEYAEISQDRGILYCIALANLKTEDVEFIPLRFPYCQECKMFAHHILYLVPSASETFAAGGISDDQRVIRYCPSCLEVKEEVDFNYHVPSVASAMDFLKDRVDAGYPPKEVSDQLKRDFVSTVEFFECESNLLLSALAENGYVVTHPQSGDGYYAGEVHWKHPLAKTLDETIDVHYGPWIDP